MRQREPKLRLDLQFAWISPDLPDELRLRLWTEAALRRHRGDCEVTIRFVGSAESRRLNRDFRGVDRATNVLSFPFEVPPGVDGPAGLLGDLVVCAPLVTIEAREQEKTLEAHYAHLIVHGVLHLLGFDHQSEAGALEMETLETEILDRLGYPDPYCVVDES